MDILRPKNGMSLSAIQVSNIYIPPSFFSALRGWSKPEGHLAIKRERRRSRYPKQKTDPDLKIQLKDNSKTTFGKILNARERKVKISHEKMQVTVNKIVRRKRPKVLNSYTVKNRRSNNLDFGNEENSEIEVIDLASDSVDENGENAAIDASEIVMCSDTEDDGGRFSLKRIYDFTGISSSGYTPSKISDWVSQGRDSQSLTKRV